LLIPTTSRLWRHGSASCASNRCMLVRLGDGAKNTSCGISPGLSSFDGSVMPSPRASREVVDTQEQRSSEQ
jgi:hypothetical protein